ncbi:MAG TPA: membrane or secreted protein [Cyclobacteriaceae bacterium]|mgnify:CR=1 FL=1|nr:membrane or secreted protein [Cyclobacteriaceae bacterium]HPW61052.1 membrane or secreted protein [Cyclobacteriaceae bacterium]
MKNLILFLILLSSVSGYSQDLTGAWQSGPDENRSVMIVAGKFFSVAVYNVKDKTYTGTYGGTWRLEKGQFVEVHEFNTIKPELIGTEQRTPVKTQKDKLSVKDGAEFSRIDNGTPGSLSGAWLITGRMGEDGTIQKRIPGARKTMKILSGTHFQWIAYNNETKEFFGTGGGTYTTVDGKYTETIEVFSRDNSRVGAKLEFDFSFLDGDWRHRGKSSKGEPIDEIWSKREKIGL